MARRLPTTLVLLCLALATPAFAGPFDLADATWEGCSALLGLARGELGKDRVILAATLDWEKLRASDGVLVLHPRRAIDSDEAASFMKAGGRLAVLDDFGQGDELLGHFRIHRRGLPGDPDHYLRGRPALALAFPAHDKSGEQVLGLHPTVADVRQVVLNHGTGLVHPDLTPVLEVRGRSASARVAVAVAGQVEKGRLFAMGDPSAFINLMLRYPGNRAFAGGLVRYLADGDVTEPRRGRLFILANDFDERGSFGGVTPLRKSLDRKLRQARDAFVALRDQGFPWWLHLLAASLAALGVLGWTTRALTRVYRGRQPRYARAPPLVAQGGVAGRIAVLSAPVSPLALGLIELRVALSEALSHHLDRDRPLGAAQLVEELEAQGGLDEALAVKLRRVLGLMRAAETAVLAGGSGRVTKEQLCEARAVVGEVLSRAGVQPAAR